MHIDYSLLNQAQYQAVTCTEGPVLVLAGAGSGKTRVLTHRVCYIIENGLAHGWQILAVTFTNKAADEMRNRINSMLGADSGVWVSTIHSFATQVLRKFIEKLGYGRNFSIYSEVDVERVIKRILREKNYEQVDPTDVRSAISFAKSQNIKPDDYMENMPAEDAIDAYQEVYERYEERMKENNALDFDDLLIKTVELLETCPDALEFYQKKFKYIHIDEFQDTNGIQMRIIDLLAGGYGNLFVVGDDDQSIYGWRGARIENILSFDKLYKDAKVFKLEENYRSTNEILTVANNVIKNNTMRHDKTLFTNRRGGVRVEILPLYNDRQEAERIIDTIRHLKYVHNYKDSDFAILIRNTSLTRIFEQRLRNYNISYKLFGGFKFYERKEILDVLAYLRIITNPSDDVAIERVINFPKRGFGDTSLEKLVNYAKSIKKDLFEVLSQGLDGILPKAASTAGADFYMLLCDLIDNYRSLDLYQFVKYAIERIDFESEYVGEKVKEKDKEESYNRWLNIQEFVNDVHEFSMRNPNATLEDFIATCTLVQNGDVESGEFVTVATIHAVKGLEFPVVFIAGCEEGILPSSMANKGENPEAALEEERRLMYVAATRAKDRLYMTYTSQRFRYDRVINCIPSRFVREAKGDVEEELPRLQPKREAYIPQKTYKSTYQTQVDNTYHAPTAPAKKSASDVAKFKSGVAVAHPKYGDGTVIVIDNDTITVLFKGAGLKKFVLSTAPLTIK